jgi:hypothetical protein
MHASDFPDFPTSADLVAELARRRRISVPIGDLAGALGVTPGDLLSVLARAVASGEAEAWDRESGVCASLTPLSAERAGLKVSPCGDRWVPVRSREPRRLRRPSKVGALVTLETDTLIRDQPWAFRLADMVSPESSTDAMVEGSSDSERGDWIYRDHEGKLTGPLPRMRLLLGLGIVGWPVADSDSSACPACHGRPLSPVACCLLCHRSGMDHLLPPMRKPPAAPKPGKANPRLRGGMEKAKAVK